MKDYLIARLRESSFVTGLMNIAIGAGLFWIAAHTPTVPATIDPLVLKALNTAIETLNLTLIALGGGLVLKGAAEMGLPTRTKAGEAVATAQAIDKLNTDPPKLPVATPPPTLPSPPGS